MPAPACAGVNFSRHPVAYKNPRAKWIPAPRLREDKLRGNDNFFRLQQNP